ncbi:saccharopine dehydrogenase-like oxidoreductase [Ceratitis capitata]|uniref:saccharopine dehydrogenase-like oxidoreductase n=1 Tax=Ceratitis capitata TaxID=7213 RepID=UPI00032A3AEE|nr:saccharopine dehydrogenase-like oxidoreductase [Ceratitis capitata]
MSQKLDVIIFGATGFTGQIVVEKALEVLEGLTWGIAGRNKSKLENVLSTAGKAIGKDLSAVPVILADVEDPYSIEQMAKKCKIVINCCGPYRFYGEAVVKACIEAGTHHVDISGEPQYIDGMQVKYHQLAQEKRTYIISNCGFDSIPAEMGVIHAEKNFPGTVNSCEMFWQNILDPRDRNSKAVLHAGTWESAIHAMANFGELQRLHRALETEKLPDLRPKLKYCPFVRKINILDSYFFAIHSGDRDVVMNTQRLRYINERKRPIQFENYIGFGSLWTTILTQLILLFTVVMAQIPGVRNILIKNPKLFTRGYMSHEGPVAVNRAAQKFQMTFRTKGWTEGQQLSEEPKQELLTRISALDPFYGMTALSILVAAKIVLKEPEKMPNNGGVISPGYAFAKTSLIEELARLKNGLKFEVLNLEQH